MAGHSSQANPLMAYYNTFLSHCITDEVICDLGAELSGQRSQPSASRQQEEISVSSHETPLELATMTRSSGRNDLLFTHVQRSQEKYTSRSTALVASGQTFASAFYYTSERDEWLQPCNRKLLMSGDYSDCRGLPARNGDGAGNNIGTGVSDGSSTPGRAKRVGMKKTIHCRGCSPPSCLSAVGEPYF